MFLYSIGGFDTDGKPKISKISASFEDIICDYVSAISELKKVKNPNKRACALWDAMDYYQGDIAYKLHISQPAVNQNLSWLYDFFDEKVIKNNKKTVSLNNREIKGKTNAKF